MGIVSGMPAFSAGRFDFFRFYIETCLFGAGSFRDDTESEFDGFKLVLFLLVRNDAYYFLGDA